MSTTEGVDGQDGTKVTTCPCERVGDCRGDREPEGPAGNTDVVRGPARADQAGVRAPGTGKVRAAERLKR